MIYLIGEIFVYLLAALLVGAVAGWLLRDWRAGQARGRETALPAIPMPRVIAEPVEDPRVAELASALAGAEGCARALEARAETQAEEAASLARRLTTAERRVDELERERALQNRALQVLHQQLELAIERREPKPVRSVGTAA